MFGSSWVVGVVINMTSNGAVTMGRLASQTRLANAQLGATQGIISKNQLAMIRYQERMDALRLSALRLGTALSAAFAGVGIAGMTTAVSDAAKLQQILLSIKNETGASQSQIGGFYNAAFSIANKTGMDVLSAGEILRTISRLSAGQFDVAKMINVAPTVADFASKVHFNRPDISVEEAAKTGIQTAHLFRAYQPEALAKLLDSAYRLSGMMSEKPDAALRQMSYYVPMFKAMNVSDDTSIATMALLDRAGFRNKVGTNVRAMVLEALGPQQMTKFAQSGKAGILEQMGLFKNGKFAWNNKDGSLNFFGELGAVGDWAQKQRAKGVPSSTIAQEMFGALGKQGGTIGALFLDPQMAPILAGLRKYLSDPNVGLAAAGKNRDQGLGFQFGRAVNNLKAVMTELGYPWLTDLTNFFRGIGDSLHNFQAWLHSHRDAEKAIGATVAGLTVMFTALAGFGAISLLLRGIGMSGIGGVFSAIGTGLRSAMPMLDMLMTWGPRLAGVLIPVVPVVGWVATAITLAIEAFRHATDIAWMLGKMTGWMQYHLWPGIVSAWQKGTAWLGKELGQMLAAMLHGVLAFIHDPTAAARGWAHGAGKSLHGDEKAIADWWSHVVAAYQAGHQSEAPGGLNVTVNLHGDHGKNPHHTGRVVGAAVVSAARQAGLTRNHPVGAGLSNAVPAAH